FRDGPVAFVLKNGDAVAFRCQGQFAFFDFYVFRLQNQLCRHEPFLQLILAAMTCCLRSSRSRRCCSSWTAAATITSRSGSGGGSSSSLRDTRTSLGNSISASCFPLNTALSLGYVKTTVSLLLIVVCPSRSALADRLHQSEPNFSAWRCGACEETNRWAVRHSQRRLRPH